MPLETTVMRNTERMRFPNKRERSCSGAPGVIKRLDVKVEVSWKRICFGHCWWPVVLLALRIWRMDVDDMKHLTLLVEYSFCATLNVLPGGNWCFTQHFGHSKWVQTTGEAFDVLNIPSIAKPQVWEVSGRLKKCLFINQGAWKLNLPSLVKGWWVKFPIFFLTQIFICTYDNSAMENLLHFDFLFGFLRFTIVSFPPAFIRNANAES